MSNGVSLQVTGGLELERQLKELSDDIVRKVAVKAIRAGTRLMFSAVKASAPFGPGKPKIRRNKRGDVAIMDYGHLRDNIRMGQESKKLREAAQSAGVFEFAISVGHAFWGRFLEDGTVKMAARPWMRPAFDSNTDAVVEKVGAELKNGIDAHTRKNGG